MKPLLVTSGEPAGIGPDLCLTLAGYPKPLVVAADKDMLLERARALHLTVECVPYRADEPVIPAPERLTVMHIPCAAPVQPGVLDPRNAKYVLELLSAAASGCMTGEFSGVCTAPVHKGVINDGGFPFTGHTEYFAEQCAAPQVVMMLVCEVMRVALVTTHMPLHQVASHIKRAHLERVLTLVHHHLQRDFGVSHPVIAVAGLNPHAGEGGHLGTEEISEITPAINALRATGMDIRGPFSADTMFADMHKSGIDSYVAMYHDQGLPVLKYAGFGTAVNVTLGLPVVRTSVDHGSALELAATGRAHNGSLLAAVKLAQQLADTRRKDVHN
ncbi:4-hydroxythreonine-4-phosphate dehydrogenase [Legionella geestiana]|uniref:4-hydroxythreonine-4-phosphate dehydrogenase n=1 Tax=Legionella geestiana TaxID=45065 RepID=A0A0W0TTJ6_9GAMM|nr:4-hydroxythreonine-4-phosphate dehydrogenase PdxA [Legionella geestiana]KTC99075.1 4-hydroxythreonine-4-phosphate dehydrogenase [Legionella geestiana]QBS12587.1 4-hydroxythreonine-4-phosphate dehydrogenase PdxA [Legionella geestiana]QDQ39697.1 4-hydroxythreonine-4-phosphate dehydrogenase PdxA [Legionella geestiana]STX54959.1 4-hydroxythreonine-4-phosphate dehydrogenase [Legionella geestiana]